ncbi:MAG: hypothetical protein U0794_08445 [Isosphaeraceae bacterium]
MLYVGAMLAGLPSANTVHAAAPAAPSYQAALQTIERVRADWAAPGATPDPNAPGWNALFESLLNDLKRASSAINDTEGLSALNRVYEVSAALEGVAWPPAQELRENLRSWLRPRVRIAWANRRLIDTIQALPQAGTSDVQANREKWLRFVDNDLGKALATYDSAATVAERTEALRGVHKALDALQSRNQAFPWNPSLELQAALNDLYNLPNLDVSADVATLSPLFNVNLVTSGPVYRKGYWSQVTAGPKTGFGLMHCDDGIAFFNSQLLSSVTPIHDFQNQIASDRRGRRAARMYDFGATSTDQQQLSVVTVLRSTGLELYPSFAHNVGLMVTSGKQPGGGLQRMVASLVGFNQARITEMVRENAYGPMQQNVVAEAAEMGAEKTSAEAAQRNANLRQFLPGGNRLTYGPVLIEGLSLRSRPENALISGLLSYLNGPNQLGADAPQPTDLVVPDSGVSADLHLSSILTNFTRGFLESDQAKSVENVMVVTRKVPPDAPPADAFQVSQNVDYPTFLKAVEEARAANDPKVLAIRVKRPSRTPDFGVDQQGNLVALIHDFQIEVPAPKQNVGGAVPPAKVYRLTSPLAEVTVSFRIEPQTADKPLRLKGKVVGFDPGPRARMFAVNDDETKAQAVTAFTSALVFGVFRTRIAGQPIDVPLRKLNLDGVVLRSATPLDPSGWMRVVLDWSGTLPAQAGQ